VGFLSQLESAPGVIERLLRHLVRCQMVFHAVVCRGNPVRVSGFFVHFSGYSMRIQWQTHLLADQLTPRRKGRCPAPPINGGTFGKGGADVTRFARVPQK